MKVLQYVILKPRAPITMNLYAAEAYEAAIVVQPLIGTLTYYSNFGRYESRLAKKWFRISQNSWRFELYPDLICENGEKITAASFKKSLERTIKHLSSYPIPILSKLKGHKEFINGADNLEGITADKNTLTFNFTKPIRSGLVQILSFSPFGYIPKDNLNPDGSWKDKEKFISSGPFKLNFFSLGKEYVLVKNKSWHQKWKKNAPLKVVFTHDLPKTNNKNNPLIVDNFNHAIDNAKDLTSYKLVPEYLNAVLLGNLANGLFSNIGNRKIFRNVLNKNKKKIKLSTGNFVLSDTFYPNQDLSGIESIEDEAKLDLGNKKMLPVVIDGDTHMSNNNSKEETLTWKALKLTLEELKIPYKFSNTKESWKTRGDQSFDIRLRKQSIGGGIEVWGLDTVFCSNLGVRLPDPSGTICKIIREYEEDIINDENFSKFFFKSIRSDSAILPVQHSGGELFISEHINQTSINPTLNVIKFDQLELR